MAAIQTDEAASPQSPRLRTRSGLCPMSTCHHQFPGVFAFECFGYRYDVLRRVSTAAAGNIDQSCPCKVAQKTGHVLRPQVEPGLRERVWQTGVWIARDGYVCLFREFAQKRI